eukprot:ANDGO_04762.mRNA.1 hypothetical protein
MSENAVLISAGLNCTIRWQLDVCERGVIPQSNQDSAGPTYPFDWIGVTTPALPLVLRHGIGDCFEPSKTRIVFEKSNLANPHLWVESEAHGHLVVSMHDVPRESIRGYEAEISDLRAKFQRRLDRLRSFMEQRDVILIRYQRRDDPTDPALWTDALRDTCAFLRESFPLRKHLCVVVMHASAPMHEVPSDAFRIDIDCLPLVQQRDPDNWQEHHYNWPLVFQMARNEHSRRWNQQLFSHSA